MKSDKTTGTSYGYARISTTSQCEDRQVLALTEQGISTRNIYVEKQSGKDLTVQNINA